MSLFDFTNQHKKDMELLETLVNNCEIRRKLFLDLLKQYKKQFKVIRYWDVVYEENGSGKYSFSMIVPQKLSIEDIKLIETSSITELTRIIEYDSYFDYHFLEAESFEPSYPTVDDDTVNDFCNCKKKYCDCEKGKMIFSKSKKSCDTSRGRLEKFDIDHIIETHGVESVQRLANAGNLFFMTMEELAKKG